MHHLTIATRARRQLLDITDDVQRAVATQPVTDGMCLVYSPHTSAAVTVNENADPDVLTDLLLAFADVVGDERRFKHFEGNSGAHVLTSLIGPSVTLPVVDGRVALGRWQGIFLCELDGPRERTLSLQVVG
jgi:secondary thiamine-phosphate synthase enzyme